MANPSVDRPADGRKLRLFVRPSSYRTEKEDKREPTGVLFVLGVWLLIFLGIAAAVFVTVKLRRDFKRSHPVTNYERLQK